MKIKSFEELDIALLSVGKLSVSITKREADMNAKMQKLREAFDNETSEERSNLADIESEVQAFCIKNKTEFDHQRTKECVHGSVGFRTNPPKVLQLNKKFSIKTSLELIKKIFDGKYVRSKDELNKDMVLADYATKEITDDKLAAIGLRIDQDETFFYEINWETLKAK